MTVPFLHTVHQPRPNRTYNLHALPNIVFTGAWGLGLPPEMTQDELVLERGVFQHGSTLSILKLPPTREFVLGFKINEQCTPAQYFAARRELIEIFNVVHIANGQTSGTTPAPFVYSMTIPGYRKYNVQFVYRDGLGFDESQAPDHRAFDIDVRVMSPSVTLWEDLVQIEINGFTSTIGGPYNDILNPFNFPLSTFIYEGSWPARFRLEFQRTFPPSITTLYSIIMRDVTNSFSYTFRHVNYPAGGWTFGGVMLPQNFVFDSIQEIATYSDAAGAGNNQNLALAAHQNSDWRDWQFYPGIEYAVYLETDTALRLVTGIVADGRGLSFYPRHVGI